MAAPSRSPFSTATYTPFTSPTTTTTQDIKTQTTDLLSYEEWIQCNPKDHEIDVKTKYANKCTFSDLRKHLFLAAQRDLQQYNLNSKKCLAEYIKAVVIDEFHRVSNPSLSSRVWTHHRVTMLKFLDRVSKQQNHVGWKTYVTYQQNILSKQVASATPKKLFNSTYVPSTYVPPVVSTEPAKIKKTLPANIRIYSHVIGTEQKHTAEYYIKYMVQCKLNFPFILSPEQRQAMANAHSSWKYIYGKRSILIMLHPDGKHGKIRLDKYGVIRCFGVQSYSDALVAIRRNAHLAFKFIKNHLCNFKGDPCEFMLDEKDDSTESLDEKVVPSHEKLKVDEKVEETKKLEIISMYKDGKKPTVTNISLATTFPFGIRIDLMNTDENLRSFCELKQKFPGLIYRPKSTDGLKIPTIMIWTSGKIRITGKCNTKGDPDVALQVLSNVYDMCISKYKS